MNKLWQICRISKPVKPTWMQQIKVRCIDINRSLFSVYHQEKHIFLHVACLCKENSVVDKWYLIGERQQNMKALHRCMSQILSTIITQAHEVSSLHLWIQYINKLDGYITWSPW